MVLMKISIQNLFALFFSLLPFLDKHKLNEGKKWSNFKQIYMFSIFDLVKHFEHRINDKTILIVWVKSTKFYNSSQKKERINEPFIVPKKCISHKSIKCKQNSTHKNIIIIIIIVGWRHTANENGKWLTKKNAR